MKVGVISYSYRAMVKKGLLQEIDLPAQASKAGFETIDFSGLYPPAGEDKPDYARRIRNACDLAGIAIGNYAVGADFLNAPGGPEAEISRLQAEVDLAVTLGAVSMRHDVTTGRRGVSFDSILPEIASYCRAVTEYAAGKGIRTMTENHGFYCQDSDRLEKLVTAVSHPNYGILVDVANFLCADEDPASAVTRVAPYAFHLHVKDFHFKSGLEPDPGEGWFSSRSCNRLRGAILGHGVVPVRQCLQIMKRTGYAGDVTLEFEGMEDPLTGIQIGLQNLRRYLAGD